MTVLAFVQYMFQEAELQERAFFWPLRIYLACLAMERVSGLEGGLAELRIF